MTKKPAEEKVEKVEEAAIDTLHPNSQPAPLPKTKLDALAAVIGALAEVDKGSLPNLFDKVQSTVVAAGRAGLDTADRNKDSIKAKPSDASPGPTWFQMAAKVKELAREEVKDMFSGQELSEDFRNKATLIFETALDAQVKLAVARLEEENEKKIEEFQTELEDDLVKKIDEHLNYVVEGWLTENAVAIESSLRSDLTAEFIDGLKRLFAEHYIDIPEDKTDVVEELSKKVDELSARLEKAIHENAQLKEQSGAVETDSAFAAVTKGLPTSQVEKLKKLANGIEYTDISDFSQKLEVIKENYFPKAGKKAPQALNEGVENPDQEKVVSAGMRPYVDAISRSVRR